MIHWGTKSFSLDSYKNSKVGNLDKTKHDCKICLNRGYLFSDDDYMMNCTCLTIRKNIYKAEQSGLGDLLQHRVKNFKAIESWQKALKVSVSEYILNSQKEWLMILGQSGSGKTMLASAVCNEYLKQGKQVMYLMWRDYVINMKNKIFKDDQQDRYFKEYANAEVLYIDDMFKGSITQADADYAFMLINHRYNNNLKTIITSERYLDELRDNEHDLEAVVGRMTEKAQQYCKQIAKDPKRNYRFKQEEVL